MYQNKIDVHNFSSECDVSSIAYALVALSGAEDVSEYEMTNTMRDLFSIAENPCNRDGWRMIYDALDKLTIRFEHGDFEDVCDC